MAEWHETLAARLGLRLGGGALLSAAWFVGSLLYKSVHAHPPRAASLGELGLCALLVLLLVTGNALLFVGPGLWREVAIPARWSAVLVAPREVEVFGHPEHAAAEEIIDFPETRTVLPLRDTRRSAA
ncbi:hypothetical protein [Novosphingobium sp.]|jgi:hypothetical protein|uniref:hypothetical protein n=1 Tax=Novosphingobium sp. TaxID=1874826 RepID=UPI002FE00E85